MITILTPTYNRGYIIHKAYQSLLEQTNQEFEWIVIDDGSVDNTKEIIHQFMEEEKIPIRYFYKANGGKHTALNFGFKKAKGEFLLILDSDDYLTANAVEKIYEYWEKYKDNKSIAALSFLRIRENGEKIGKVFSQHEIIANNISFRYNQNIYGDMAEVYRTKVLKKKPFPVFERERYLSEAIVWNKIALDYDTVYINEGIYVCEYQNDGLTKKSLELRFYNPIGALENANLFMISKFKLSIRVKNAILYDGFSLIARRNLSTIIACSNNKFLTLLFFPAGLLFELILKMKFLKKRKL